MVKEVEQRDTQLLLARSFNPSTVWFSLQQLSKQTKEMKGAAELGYLLTTEIVEAHSFSMFGKGVSIFMATSP